jgi:hypothetical protein
MCIQWYKMYTCGHKVYDGVDDCDKKGTDKCGGLKEEEDISLPYKCEPCRKIYGNKLG